MDEATFKKVSKAVIADGNAARQKLILTQTKYFLNGSAKFNPTIFRRMEEAEFSAFFRTVQKRKIAFTALPKPTPDTKPEMPSTLPPGWADQRRAEPHWGLHAMTNGIMTGLVLITFVAVGFFLFNIFH